MWDSKIKALTQIRQGFSGEIFAFKASISTQMKRSKTEDKTRKLDEAYRKLTDIERQMVDVKAVLKSIEEL